ncbi:MAG: periplasmic heavy metal sensor [Acidobacteria bacterium]|nr:periplasmic heavy metal sensor [Acidobacteriota bacterium]
MLKKRIGLFVVAIAVLATLASAVTIGRPILAAGHAASPFLSGSPASTVLKWLLDLHARLDLTADQDAGIKAIFTDHKTELVSIGKGEKSARMALQKAIRHPSVNMGAIEAASAVIADLDADLAVERGEVYAEVWALLTETQKTALTEYMAETQARLIQQMQSFANNPDFSALGFDRLKLTAGQKAAIKDVLESHRKDLKSLAGAEKKARMSLLSAIRQPSVNEAAIRGASADVAALDLQLATHRAQIYSEVRALLTAKQQAELDKILQENTQKVIDQIEMVIRMIEILL